MLKFIRKYQLIILAIGGSLLMVVFLLQPVLTRLTPDSRNDAVARLEDGTVFNGFDTSRANFDLSVLKSIYPSVYAPLRFGGFGLDPVNDRDTEFHWLLLTKQARDAGLIGDDADGRTWIPTLAQQQAIRVVQQEARQGNFSTQEEAGRRLEEVSSQIENNMTRSIRLASGRMQGIDENEVFRTLAKARGVQRLLGLYNAAPAVSDLNAINAAVEQLSAVAVNAAAVPGLALGAQIPEPSEEELRAFFERFEDQRPADNEYGIGYTQPPRVKLGWLTLDRARIEESIEIDRVELRKIWTRDREKPVEQREYPGDFAGERAEIERAYREDLAQDVMIEADRVIRAEVLRATSALNKTDGVFVLPDGWQDRRPSLESIAEEVVARVSERLGTTIATPSITIRTDQWLTTGDIGRIEGFGGARYRMGSNTIQTSNIPTALDDTEAIELLGMQEGVPQVDPAAQDDQGNRYYALVYEARPAGPARSIEDAGRETVLEDYRSLKGFEILRTMTGDLRDAIESSGSVRAAIDLAFDGVASDTTRPEVIENLLVRRDQVGGVRGAGPALNSAAFRDAVRARAERLDPLATPEQVASDPIGVAVEVRQQRAVALARIVAPRPLTRERYRGEIVRIAQSVRQQQRQEAMNDAGAHPFAYEMLRERHGFRSVDEPDSAEPESGGSTDQDQDQEQDKSGDTSGGTS